MGFNDFEFRASGLKNREYCIQHNESDLHFVLRLLEEDGISYYFKHTDSKHQLILVDHSAVAETCDETDLEYSQGSNPNAQITRWDRRYAFKKNKWTLNDYDFKSPDKVLLKDTTTKSPFGKDDKFEHYEYPGLYESSLGADLATMRIEAEEMERDVVFGGGNCSSFCPGYKFKLAKHAHTNESGTFVLTSVSHSAFDHSHLTDQHTESAGYTNYFNCVPEDVHIRPPRRHFRPYMRGPQTAVVVGPSGEEIYYDEHGRIKVQFIWDREGEKNENSSCWLRVSQTWAGNGWGSHFIPRIGHEVIVNFFDGDPDRPFVSGSVYNGKNKIPYENTAQKTCSGIKTRSSKDGSAANYNEFRFDDKKGEEQVYIHAEKNMDTMIENDETLTVDHDRIKHIKNDETYTIDNNRKKTIANNQTESIGKDKSTSVGGDHSETIKGNMSITVKQNLLEKIEVDYTENVDGEKKSTIKKDLTESIKANHSESVTKNYTLKAKKIQLTADDEITFKTGSASIIMKKNGDIQIKGKKITVKGSGDVIIKGSNIKEN